VIYSATHHGGIPVHQGGVMVSVGVEVHGRAIRRVTVALFHQGR